MKLIKTSIFSDVHTASTVLLAQSDEQLDLTSVPSLIKTLATTQPMSELPLPSQQIKTDDPSTIKMPSTVQKSNTPSGKDGILK